MPMLAALAGAAFSVSAGLTAGGVLGGMMVAGGAISGLGAVTGNKKLTKIGGVLSLAGGVGSLASSAMNAAKTAGESAASAALNEGAGASLADGVLETAASQSSAFTPTNPLSTPAEGVGYAAPSLTAGDVATQAGLIGQSVPSSVFQAPPLPVGQPGFQAPSLIQPTTSSGIVMDALRSSPVGKTAGDWFNAAKETAGKVSDWSKANPQTAQLVGGLVQGAAKMYADPKLAAQTARAQVQEQARLSDLMRQRYSDSIKNLVIPTLSAPAVRPIGG